MGAYTLLVDHTVTEDTLSITFNNFGTITKDDFVKVVVTRVDANNAAYGDALAINGITNNNYDWQRLQADGSTVVALRFNNQTNGFNFNSVLNNTSSTSIGYLKIAESGNVSYFSHTNASESSIVRNGFVYSSTRFTVASITSFTWNQNNASRPINPGSRIQIYKLAATKVADITVSSNTTQVDISNLSIDKDSEYLLVADVIGTTDHDGFLMVNDITTASSYHSQRIVGNGSTASAVRINQPRYNQGTNILSYVYIKLSNIGAFTYQSYSIIATGSSSLHIFNNFGSTTAENITSITKINLVTAQTNAIGAGSRYILYKLYE